MEGYLFKKGRGDSSFGRRNWKRRWFILEENELRYYDDLDTQGQPSGLRDAIDIGGCSVLPVTHHEKKFTFVLKFPPEANCADILMQAPDAKAMNLWIKEISAAARGENLHTEINYGELYELLGLSEEDEPSVSDISRAYRRAALKAHPDKGGNMAQFKEIQNAYQQIIARIEEEENEKLFDTLEYEAILVKGAGDAGLGLLVSEDAQKRTISIKDVLPAVQIKSLKPATVGSLKAGDILIAIRNEDVIQMPLTRVAQKLNEARVPVNSAVKLTFRRKYRKDGSDHYGVIPPSDEAEGKESKSDKRFTDEVDGDSSTPSAKVYGTETQTQQPSVSVPPSPSPLPQRTPSQHSTSSSTPNTPHNQSSQRNPPQHNRFEESADLPDSNKYSSHIDPVTYVAVMAENDELKIEMNSKDNELQKSRSENERLKEELVRYQQGYNETDLQKRRLEVHLQHAYLLSKMSREQMASSMSQILLISKKVLSRAPIEANAEIEYILGKENLNEEQVINDAVKIAQRTAIVATMNMEVLGHTVHKWMQEGDNAVQKLERLEEKIKGVDAKLLARPPSPVKSNSSHSTPLSAPLRPLGENTTAFPRGQVNQATAGNTPNTHQIQYSHPSSNGSVGSQTSHQSAPLPRPAVPYVSTSPALPVGQQTMMGSLSSPSYMNPTKTSGPRGAPLNRSQTTRY